MGEAGKRTSLDEWAESDAGSAAEPAYPNCSTCKRHPELVGEIREYLQKRVSGQITKSVEWFWVEYLRGRRGYTLAENTLWRHIRLCESDLYQKALRRR